MQSHNYHSEKKLQNFFMVVITLLIAGCGYYDPIRPDDLRSPFPPMPSPQLEGYKTYVLDDVKLVVSNHDYTYGCDSYLFHRVYEIDETGDFGKEMHLLGSGGDPEEFKDEISITIPYDIYDYNFEVVYNNLVIYRYDLYRNYVLDLDDFEQLPACVDDKKNHTVTVKTNRLRGRYIVGRPR